MEDIRRMEDETQKELEEVARSAAPVGAVPVLCARDGPPARCNLAHS